MHKRTHSQIHKQMSTGENIISMLLNDLLCKLCKLSLSMTSTTTTTNIKPACLINSTHTHSDFLPFVHWHTEKSDSFNFDNSHWPRAAIAVSLLLLLLYSSAFLSTSVLCLLSFRVIISGEMVSEARNVVRIACPVFSFSLVLTNGRQTDGQCA